jgi:3-oxosteroid 1-dehydrogenase
MIFDDRYLNRNLIMGQLPGKGLSQALFDNDIAFKADTIGELAGKIGVSADALRETHERFNDFARKGVDLDFHRGESSYENYYGDPSYPNPNLATIEQPPFYAIKMVPGDLGTKGGLLTNENAQVLRADGTVIPGLYACGNASASVMGHDYAGPGATIGPAMTFGYVAVRHIAGAYGTGPERSADSQPAAIAD